MGCNETAASITANNTGNPACSGYELRANLDFNTNSSAPTATNPTGADSGDTYWNAGAGFVPIGDATNAFTSTFDGNNDTDASGDGGPYTISNLFINASHHRRRHKPRPGRPLRPHRQGRGSQTTSPSRTWT